MERFIKLGLVLFASFGNILAQQGYNYDRPKQPFETSDTFPSSPGTARYPTGPGGFPSSTGLTQRPGSQRPSGYPGTSSSTDGSTPGTRPTGDSIFKPSFPTGPQTGYQSSGFKPSTSTAQGTDATFPGAPVGSDYQQPGFKPSISTGQKPSTGGYSGTPSNTGGGYQGTISTGQGTGIPSTTRSGYQQSGFKPSIAPGQKTGAVFPGAGTGTPTTGTTLGGTPAGDYFGQTSTSGDGYQKSGFKPSTTTAQRPGSTFPGTFPTPSYQAPGFRPSIPTGEGDGGVFPGTTGGFVNGQQQVEEDEDEGDYSAIPGEPGTDYPIYSEIPSTSFSCDAQQYPGYYADTETRCQIFHICANNKTYDFLCPNGTVFHQEYLVCVWWNQFDCSTAPSLYGINAYIYDYSINGVLQQMAGFSQSGVAGGNRSPITPSGGQFPTTSDGSRGYPQASGSINVQGNNRYPGATGVQQTPQQSGGQTSKGSYSGANDEFPRGPAVTSPQQSGGQFPTNSDGNRGYPQAPGSINRYPDATGVQRSPQQGGRQTSKGSYSGANDEFRRGPAITSPQQGGGQFATAPGVNRGYPQAPSSINPPQGGGQIQGQRPGGYSSAPRPQEGGGPSVSTDYQFPTQPSGYPGATQAVSSGSVGKDTTSGFQANQIGYPREQPSIPFPGTKPQPPNREYLPPINGK